MDHSVTLARHFARLVWLLLHEPSNVDEQKASLRAILVVSADGTVSIASSGDSGDELTANGHPLPSALSGMRDVQAQLGAHGIASVSIDAGATPAHVLGVARLLAGTATRGDGGAAAAAARETLGAGTVRFTLRSAKDAAVATERRALPDMEFGEVLDEPLAHAAASSTPRITASMPTVPASEAAGGMFSQFAAARAPTAPMEQLLAQLDGSHDAGMLVRVLDDLAVLAERAGREGRPGLVSDILCRIVAREPSVEPYEAKRAFVLTLRRLAKPVLLRAVVMQLPFRRDRREELLLVLSRAGEDGADAVIEQLVAVADQSERRIYFDALVSLRAGTSTLLHMLGDARWFVARNAADLLGEMQVREAEQPLIALLRHGDERVRQSAQVALMRLGTPRALQSIQDAMRDGTPSVRIQAAAALAARQDVRTDSTLMRALDEERDLDVQAAYLVALGRVGTPEAVQRLTRATEAERGLFKKRPVALRIAAVQGLAEARTPEALEALRALQADREADVRDAATLALGRVARQAAAAE